mgnify:CR=1 FL=1
MLICTMRQIIAIFLALFLSIQANAFPRSLEQMQRAAMEALNNNPDASIKKNGRLPKLLAHYTGLSILGYEEGGFAIIANDDMYPEVLGVSNTTYNPQTNNLNFRWWLDVTETFVSQSRNVPFQTVKPDTLRFPASVSPLMTTKWGQEEPYSNLVPHRFPTGCVATAAAQVLKYNQWPEQGRGTVFTYYPFGDFDGSKYEENIEGVKYEYDLMPDYCGIRLSAAQKKAVATLMYHVGLAMKAQYTYDGTGAYSVTLCHGLRNNLGYPLAVTLDRDRYSEKEWMDMIFANISKGYPIVYGGSDTNYNGHEFVLHGYNSSGKIYVNWGWDGEEDGYYDLSSLLLMWGFYDFRYYQDMVLRTNIDQIDPIIEEVNVDEPGTLLDLIGEERCDSVFGLRIAGRINGTDVRTLRRMAGSDLTGHGTMGNLSILDLSETEIVAGGECYMVCRDDSLYISDNEMPYKAFSDCSMLIDVSLPRRLKHYDDGVFSGCSNLDVVRIEPDEESDFIVVGPYVMTNDSTELIECLPTEDMELAIPYGTKRIHDDAFAGRYLYERLIIPETVENIGVCAFNRCYDLSRTYCYAAEPPAIDVSAIDKLDLSLRYLYVPNGSKSKYLNVAGWKLYGNKGIMEFDPMTMDVDDVYMHTIQTRQHVYDVSGRIVKQCDENTKRKGIYIVSGKKILH